jgi:Circularly permuted ATP-grasp type 2
VIGPRATAEELAMLKAKVQANPRGWLAQRPVALSTSPVLVGEKLAPRHIDLRPFAVNDGSDVWVLPGGLTRVALPEGELVVNSSQGGGSKDTWVLAQPRPGQTQTQSQTQTQQPAQPVVITARSSGPEVTPRMGGLTSSMGGSRPPSPLAAPPAPPGARRQSGPDQ